MAPEQASLVLHFHGLQEPGLGHCPLCPDLLLDGLHRGSTRRISPAARLWYAAAPHSPCHRLACHVPVLACHVPVLACRLVGVARVPRVDDLLLNTFLQLPTDALAIMSADISFE